jgi:hypothetical protein
VQRRGCRLATSPRLAHAARRLPPRPLPARAASTRRWRRWCAATVSTPSTAASRASARAPATR